MYIKTLSPAMLRSLRGKFKISKPPDADKVTFHNRIKKSSTKNYYTLDRGQAREKVIESGAYTEKEIKRIEAEGCKKVSGNALCISPFSGYRYYLSLKYSNEIVKGLKILMEAVAADSGEMLIGKNYPPIQRAFKGHIERAPNICIKLLNDFYPLAHPAVLYKKLYNLKTENFPGYKGILIAPVEKLFKIYLCVEEENTDLMPVRVVAEKINIMLWVEKKKSISEILNLAGVGNAHMDENFIIKGDLLYGSCVIDPEKETMKDAFCLFVVSRTEVKLNLNKCVACGRCLDICPQKLKHPYSMVVLNKKAGLFPFSEITGCIGCGLCGFLCLGC